MKKDNDLIFILLVIITFNLILGINIVYLRKDIEELKKEISALNTKTNYIESEIEWYDEHWIEWVNE